MEKLIVERIEEGIVLLERQDKTLIKEIKENIGFDVKEGSVLNFDGVRYSADEDSEAQRRRKIFELQQKLMERGK